MPLDRKTVDRAAADHVRMLRKCGVRLTDREKQAVRRLHERVADKVARKAKR